MIKTSAIACLVLSLLFVSSIQIKSQQPSANVKTGIFTLYPLDPLANTLCFTDGECGRAIQDDQVKNRCSHLTYHTYSKDQFTIAIQGSDIGFIADLRTASDLENRYGYKETLPQGQGFASIHRDLQSSEVVILKDYKQKTYQPLKEADFPSLNNRDYKVSTAVALGHIYLLRIKNESRTNPTDILVKMIVLAYKPNEYVTIRWEKI